MIIGFTTEDPKFKTNLDVDRAVAVYGHRIIGGEEVDHNEFWEWLKVVERRA